MDVVTTREIEGGEISSVHIISRDRDVFLYAGETDTFVIKEYMNRGNKKYLAHINNSGNELTVEAGKKPAVGLLMIGFKARFELYVPQSYSKKLSVKTFDGNITCSVGKRVNEITLDAADGNINLNIPKEYEFNFTADIADGKLSTPFPERLTKSVQNDNIIQGIIGLDSDKNNKPIHTITLKTKDGSVLITWLE